MKFRSGYGRSGKFFAHQYNDIKPDLITVAKGIGNGFPMAGVLISPMFKPVYGQLGTTFGGNHLACSAALAVMDVIEQENLIENAKVVGNYLLEELKKFPQIKEVRGRGLMIGLEFEEPIKELRSRLIYDEHVFTGSKRYKCTSPVTPLCLTMEEAEDFPCPVQESTLIAHLINKQPTIKAAFIRNLFLIPAAFCFFRN